MKERIFLTIGKQGTTSMRKTLPDIKKNEIIVKLTMDIEDSIFGKPTIEKEIKIENWSKGIDIQDVEFNNSIITEEEAELIKTRRLEKMMEILKNQGYNITKDE